MPKKVLVRKGNVELGRFSLEEFIEKLKMGKISCYDEIFYEKTGKWLEIDRIRDIDKYAGKDFHWKYETNNEIHGPIAREDLIFFIKEGKILQFDKVYHPCLKGWKIVKEVDGLKQLLNKAKQSEEKQSELGEALKTVNFKMCPKCGMQNLANARYCIGCGYAFPESQ
ncbi:MAG: hypothetical protein B5M53_11580 [Candidatus Cloacimonas sp. 4484_209]|nr:MAG: hypothetical protein B5M53_11580 [Candidatus Cloacimonas sp. 4484_209]